MEQVNYKWVIGQGWVVDSKNKQLKLMVENALKETDKIMCFNDYLKQYSIN